MVQLSLFQIRRTNTQPLTHTTPGQGALLDLQGHSHIWAIGGGKGGVGKSLVTANLSICLAMMGHKVVSVDLDLGGANLHTCLGVPIPELTLSDFLTKKVEKIEDLLTKTTVQNLSIISGAQDELGMANIKTMHKNKILSHLAQLNADFILFDLGAGTTHNTLDFFISSENGILVVLPEPTSIENTYRFIKSTFYRRLQHVEDLLEVRPLIDQVMNAKISAGVKNSPAELIARIKDINLEKGTALELEMHKFRPKIIINQVRTQADIDIGFSMQTVCKRYFGLELDFIGYLDYDAAVWQSVKKRRPLILEFPHSRLVSNFDKIVRKMLVTGNRV